MSKKIINNTLLVTIGLLLISIITLVTQNKLKSAPEPINQHTTNYSLPTTHLFFAGDIMLSRNVAKKIYESNNHSLPFEQVKDFIKQADISFANLESPFNDTGVHSKEGSLVFNADPQSIAGLKDTGFDLLSTANNHALDQGLKGLDYTIKLLKDNGIIPTGTIGTTGESDPAVIVKNKVAFGFLSYSYTGMNDGKNTASPYVNDFNDLEKLKQDILRLRGHYADVVIVTMHAGTEYTRTPTAKQIAFAHAAIDAGADLVVGAHPHWIQTVEQYQGKWIFYSLGNFVFDQMFSAETREGLTVLVTYEYEHIADPKNETAGEDKISIKKVELKPIIIDNYCCARWANEQETANILKQINITDSVLFEQ